MRSDPGMANLGTWDREGGLPKRKEVELDLVDSSGRILRWPRLQNVMGMYQDKTII